MGSANTKRRVCRFPVTGVDKRDEIHRSDLRFPYALLFLTPVSYYRAFCIFFQSSVHHHLQPRRPTFPHRATILRTISER
jgi:hypothetical protein